MSYRGSGLATVDVTSPSAWGVCDRCSTWRLYSDLVWAYDYRGNSLQNLRILVCKEVERCNDLPQNQLRPVIIPPDPISVRDPRLEPFSQDYAPSQTVITDDNSNDLTNDGTPNTYPAWLVED